MLVVLLGTPLWFALFLFALVSPFLVLLLASAALPSLSLLIAGLAVHSRGRLSILVCPRVGIYPFYGSSVRVIYLCHTSINIRSICRTFLSRSVVPCSIVPSFLVV